MSVCTGEIPTTACDFGGLSIMKCKTIPAFNPTLISLAVAGASVTLAKISIDTSALCNPSTLVSIFGNISSTVAIAVGSSITLVKIVGDQEEVLVSHAIPAATLLNLLATTNFAYQYCDCEGSCSTCNCNTADCVIYELRYNPGTANIGVNLSFTNVTISAIAVEKRTEPLNLPVTTTE